MSREPEEVETDVVPVVNVVGGGCSPDGRFVGIEIKLLDGRVVPLQMPHPIADRMMLAIQQFSVAALNARTTGRASLEVASVAPEARLQATQVDFLVHPEGRSLRVVATGLGGPVQAFELLAETVPGFAKKAREADSALRRLRKGRHSRS